MAEIHRIVPYPSPEPSEMDMSPIAKPDCNDGGNTSTTVMLPDLFVSIMSPSPRLNPLYELVRPAANEWTQKYVDPGQSTRLWGKPHDSRKYSNACKKK